MNELKSCTDVNTISLTEQTNFRLNEINKIKDYFESEIKDREVVTKKLSKYIAGFHYTDKVFIVLSATFSGVSIFSHLKIKNHTDLINSVLILVFSLITALIKKLLYETKKRKKNITRFFNLVKINEIVLKCYRATTDLQISHE